MYHLTANIATYLTTSGKYFMGILGSYLERKEGISCLEENGVENICHFQVKAILRDLATESKVG